MVRGARRWSIFLVISRESEVKSALPVHALIFGFLVFVAWVASLDVVMTALALADLECAVI